MLFITSKTLTKLRHNLLDSVGDTNDQESEQEPLPQPRKKSCFHCCVPQCNGDSRYHNELKFHRLPGGEAGKETRKRWLVKIRRDEGPDFKITSSTRICSRHFIDEDYQPADNAGRLLLKRGAIPTKFDWSSKPKTRRKIIRHIDRYRYM
ncbi:hypothetical protein QZH41_018331 [Actinostola sp. cb2023]|nr:hypothetical protein QZH41_018331 [Actinostola sp. cb2023]